MYRYLYLSVVYIHAPLCLSLCLSLFIYIYTHIHTYVSIYLFDTDACVYLCNECPYM